MAENPDDGTDASVPTVDVAELLPRLDRGDGILLLDVRNEEEYEGWRIEARRPVDTIHLPYFDFIEDEEGSIAQVPRGREVVVLCARGGSSEMVAGLLDGAGIHARNVSGGMIAYGLHLQPVRVPLPAEAAARYELWQINRRGKGCLSYVLVSGAEAVVVDPSRHAEWYQDFVTRRGARVVRVLDTHVHADHVSGGPVLAHAAGVPYTVTGGEGFLLRHPVTPLADGERIHVGGKGGVVLEVRTIRTPGHTPGSTSYLVDGRHLLTGDTLFVASVGRPDLGGHVEEWGRALFETLHTRLADLPDDTVILPAHYRDVVEMAEGGVVSGVLGSLRRGVPEMRIPTPEAFVEAVRGVVKEPPPAYAEIIRVNLGQQPATDEKIEEWELGKNQCAVATGAVAPG